MLELREKLDALHQCFKEKYGLEVKIIAYAFESNNPDLTAEEAVALRDDIAEAAGLPGKWHTWHEKVAVPYFTVSCHDRTAAHTEITIYCSGGWPEHLLGAKPKIDLEEAK